ncbi:FkbM family methyltransferase [Wenxinia saemankumensis]|uniref:Methyltransferase, FkbM family n=1 Tax=Wenxinia saemankumensis TaxID=1447782 RepID=A0A1M6FQH3_9RHOB|nr:FkbM family methyltransferase [Wenxinia saemankumensis]SHI99950.1 methyltransferase, FkbM family [Wenxinia saemankumensis]
MSGGPADRLRAGLAALEEAERGLVAALGQERGRRRGEIHRLLHETRRHRLPERYRYASQAGQDHVVDRLLGGRTGGTFADIGGYDGVTGSNTLFFEAWRGWTGILAEPVEAQRAAAARLRRCPCLPYAVAPQDGTARFLAVTGGFTQMSGLLDSYESGLLDRVRADPRHAEAEIEVETRTLDRLLTESGLDHPDFVSLDIEGGEEKVLETFPFSRHNVRVWAIENNTGTPRIGEIMKAAGYVLADFCGPDEIWHRPDLSG